MLLPPDIAPPAPVAAVADGRCVLPYGDVPTRWGVAFDRVPDRLRVSVPPVPGVRFLGRGFLVGGAVLVAVNATFLIAAIRGRAPWSEVGPSLGMYGAGLLIYLAVAAERLRRRLVIEVTPAGIAVWSVLRRPRLMHAWPRPLVSDVHRNRTNGKLFVRVTGRELIDLYISPNADVAECVAQAINNAMQTIPIDPAAAAAVPPVDLDPPMQTSTPGVSGRGTRRGLLAIGVAMMIAGFGVLVFRPFLAPLGVYLIFFAAAPFGIAMGTPTRRTYWP